MEVISKAEAVARGFSRYFTGKPCKRSHLCERVVGNGECLECKRQKDRERHHASAEKSRVRAARNHERNRDDRLSKMKEWRESNRESVAKSYRVWAEANRDIVNAKMRRYYLRNKELSHARTRNRRARIASADGTHSRSDIRRLEALQKMRCATCHVKLKPGYHIDHIEPIALGGSNWPWNLQLLCPTCNTRKNAMHPIAWANKNGLLL